MEGAENVSLLFTVSRSSCEDADKSGPVVAAAERSPDTKEQSEGERGKTRRMCPEWKWSRRAVRTQ